MARFWHRREPFFVHKKLLNILGGSLFIRPWRGNRKVEEDSGEAVVSRCPSLVVGVELRVEIVRVYLPRTNQFTYKKHDSYILGSN